MPTALPVTTANLNWTPVTVGAVLVVVLSAWWLPGWGARHWYLGKAHTLEDTFAAGCQVRVPNPLGNPFWVLV